MTQGVSSRGESTPIAWQAGTTVYAEATLPGDDLRFAEIVLDTYGLHSLGFTDTLPADAVPLVPVTELERSRLSTSEYAEAFRKADMDRRNLRTERDNAWREVAEAREASPVSPPLDSPEALRYAADVVEAQVTRVMSETLAYAASNIATHLRQRADIDEAAAVDADRVEVWRDDDGWTAKTPDGGSTRIWHESWGDLDYAITRHRPACETEIAALARVIHEAAAYTKDGDPEMNAARAVLEYFAAVRGDAT